MTCAETSNTTQLWPIQNPSVTNPLCVYAKSLLLFCLLLLYRLFSLSFAFKSASCLEDTMCILYLQFYELMWPTAANHAR
jgi:hypothetical protein